MNKKFYYYAFVRDKDRGIIREEWFAYRGTLLPFINYWKKRRQYTTDYYIVAEKGSRKRYGK